MPERMPPRDEYIAHALDFSDAEAAEIAAFAEWLPDNIIDAHAHSNLPEHVDDIAPSAYGHMLSTYPSYSLEESKDIHARLHPGVRIRSLRFPKTFRGLNHRAANQYLLDRSDPDDRVAIFGLPEDPEYTNEMLRHSDVAGLKMYYSYMEPPAQRVYDIFLPEIVAEAERQGVPLVLHTPKVITQSVREVLQLKQDYPNLKVSIAHLGSSKFDIPGLQEAYDLLADETDVMMDTALNPSPEVCERAIDTLGEDRIMYGSDEPLNLIRSVPYVHPVKGQRIATVYPYHWQDPAEHVEYRHLAEGVVHAHWLSLRALQAAIQRYGGDRQAVKAKIFRTNAEQFYGFAPTDQTAS